MAAATIRREKVLEVHHWNDRLFSFKTTRDPGFRFDNGHFTMIGLESEGRPLMRAYSMASANYEDHLEFLSIKVQDGPLTSKLQNMRPGDEVLVNSKPTGTLVADRLRPGKHLYLLATGTGLAPFLSIIKDPDVYERFDKVVLAHGVRRVSDLAYQDVISALPDNEYFGDMVRDKLVYYPTVTRETFKNEGRLTHALTTGRMSRECGLPELDVEHDRFMLCGSAVMLKDVADLLESWGYSQTIRDHLGEYVIERAFVEK